MSIGESMKKRLLSLTIIGLGTIIIMTACAPAPNSPPTLSADAMSTAAFQQVYVMLTQTALAASPTPSMTPSPTGLPTETFTPEPTSNVPLKRPVVTAFTGCWKGPGPQFTLISNISAKKYVEVIGVGSVPGWYVIRNPYFHNPCWIEAIYVKLDPRLDTSKFPVMTPAP
jgi:hypothetical protein